MERETKRFQHTIDELLKRNIKEINLILKKTSQGGWKTI